LNCDRSAAAELGTPNNNSAQSLRLSMRFVKDSLPYPFHADPPSQFSAFWSAALEPSTGPQIPNSRFQSWPQRSGFRRSFVPYAVP
jgi:hypothetical protein